MWKPSKLTLLILMISMAVMGGLTFSWIDWKVFDTGEGKDIYQEIQLPLIFLALGFYFMVPYVKLLKKEKN
tara:strand:- start:753 stop:965 length:213 start_codon:yes stop_codon:yes gene_type:complete